MGTIINLGKNKYTYANGKYKNINRHNGLTLTKTGWKYFNITKHRRSERRWGDWDKCSVCNEKCCQSFGSLYQRICIKCSPEWLENSIKEMDRIKAKLEEQKKNLIENKEEMEKIEKESLDKWAKLDILDKLEND